jgi:phenylacetate-coenzyme A ligase PaaK-like adenylate-forming protein
LREYLTLKELKKFSKEKTERLQNLRFRATCRYMLPYTPFYANMFKQYGIDPFTLKTVEDWQKKGLPLIKKATYMKNPKDFIVTPDLKKIFSNHFQYLDNQDEYGSAIKLLFSRKKKEILKEYYSPKMLVFSGGTESGNPTPVLLTGKQKFGTLMPILRIIGEIIQPMLPEKRTGMNVFPYAPHLGWHAVHHALDINADLNLNTAAGGAIPTERLIDLAGKAKPNIICGMSDYLRNRFLPLAIEKKITLPEKVIFVNGAQKMHDAERDKIAELARKVGVKEAIVLDLYGASELKEALLPECRPGSGYHHIAPLSTIIKTVEATHATDEVIDEWKFTEGGGYAASWNVDGAGTLLAGYFIGDKFDKTTHDKCTNCGLNTMRIYEINRIREVEAQLKLTGIVEEKVKGTRVNLAAFRDTALSLPEIKEAQVYLNRKKGLLELRIITDKPKEAIKKLTRQFAGAEIRPKIVSSTLQKLQGDKIKFEGIKVE